MEVGDKVFIYVANGKFGKLRVEEFEIYKIPYNDIYYLRNNQIEHITVRSKQIIKTKK